MSRAAVRRADAWARLVVARSPSSSTTNVVFHADDRPYGLIEGTLRRDGAPAVPDAWVGRLL